MTAGPYFLVKSFETLSSTDAEQSVTLIGKLRTQNPHRALGKCCHNHHTISPVATVLCSRPAFPRNNGNRKYQAIPTRSRVNHLQRKRCCGAAAKKRPYLCKKYMKGIKPNNTPLLEAKKLSPRLQVKHDLRCLARMDAVSSTWWCSCWYLVSQTRGASRRCKASVCSQPLHLRSLHDKRRGISQQ